MGEETDGRRERTVVYVGEGLLVDICWRNGGALVQLDTETLPKGYQKGNQQSVLIMTSDGG